MSRGFPNMTSVCTEELYCRTVAHRRNAATLTPEQNLYATRAAEQIVLSVDPARIEAWNPL